MDPKVIEFKDSRDIWFHVWKIEHSGAATLTDSIQRHGSHVLVLAIGKETSVVQIETREVQKGVYGLRQQQDSNGHIPIMTDLIQAIRQLPPHEQQVRQLALRFAHALLQDPKLGRAPITVDDIVDLEAPDNAEYVENLDTLGRAGAEAKMASDPEVAAIFNRVYKDGVIGLQVSVAKILLGRYGLIGEEYPRTQDWMWTRKIHITLYYRNLRAWNRAPLLEYFEHNAREPIWGSYMLRLHCPIVRFPASSLLPMPSLLPYSNHAFFFPNKNGNA